MAKTVKMSDIAEQLNVSTVTVSKALSDQKGVSDEMRNKIKKLAMELGYQKPIAKQEDKVRSFNVGLLFRRTISKSIRHSIGRCIRKSTWQQ